MTGIVVDDDDDDSGGGGDNVVLCITPDGNSTVSRYATTAIPALCDTVAL